MSPLKPIQIAKVVIHLDTDIFKHSTMLNDEKLSGFTLVRRASGFGIIMTLLSIQLTNSLRA